MCILCAMVCVWIVLCFFHEYWVWFLLNFIHPNCFKIVGFHREISSPSLNFGWQERADCHCLLICFLCDFISQNRIVFCSQSRSSTLEIFCLKFILDDRHLKNDHHLCVCVCVWSYASFFPKKRSIEGVQCSKRMSLINFFVAVCVCVCVWVKERKDPRTWISKDDL